MEIPESLVKPSELKVAYEKISAGYRKGRVQLKDPIDYLAYVAARSPATGAAIRAVLTEVAARITHPVHSICDVGMGPGTAIATLRELFPAARYAGVEKDPQFIALAQQIFGPLDVKPPHAADLVLCSYSLNEMSDPTPFLNLDAQTIVIIEPGTTEGFRRILSYRDHLIGQGLHMVAPCPASHKCPSSWCHFSVRVPRTKLHRYIKGTMGHEDEKYSYIAMSKHPARTASARIVASPEHKSGHTHFLLCENCQLVKKTVSRKDAHFKQAKKLEWGDSCEL